MSTFLTRSTWCAGRSALVVLLCRALHRIRAAQPTWGQGKEGRELPLAQLVPLHGAGDLCAARGSGDGRGLCCGPDLRRLPDAGLHAQQGPARHAWAATT